MEVQDDFARLAKKFGIPTRPDPSVLTRRCWGCQEPFVSREPQQRYCTRSCKAKHKPHQAPDKAPKVNYAAYIVSDDWKRKAEAAKKRAGYRCQVCNKDRSQVLQLEAHHRTYEHLGEEKSSDITVLCNECHDLFSKQGKIAKK